MVVCAVRPNADEYSSDVRAEATTGGMYGHCASRCGTRRYGIDGSPDGKVMINEGYFEGSSAQRPLEMAEIAVDMAYDYMDGKETESLVIVPVTLITLDNIDEFDLAGWQ